MPLPAGWGEAALFEAGEPAWPDATRSHDHVGATLAWRVPPGVRGACDMERLDKDVGTLPALLGAAADGFVQDWVAAEASAKVLEVPIVLWLKTRGLTADPCLGVHRATVWDRSMAFCRVADGEDLNA